MQRDYVIAQHPTNQSLHRLNTTRNAADDKPHQRNAAEIQRHESRFEITHILYDTFYPKDTITITLVRFRR